VTLPGLGPARDPQHAALVKRWVVEALGPCDDRTVMVTELACSEPGCPPVETVIALLAPGRQDQVKIHKALADVTSADVGALLRSHANPTD